MRFPIGWEVSFGGIDFKVVEGNRCPGDKILLMKTNGWVAPKIAHTLAMVDFKYEVEENNYGPGVEGRPLGKIKAAAGWGKLKMALIDTFFQGWQKVAREIEGEARNAAERRKRG